jgi:hypothetical protein
MKFLNSTLAGLLFTALAGCDAQIYPRPYRSTVVLSADVAPHVRLVTPLSATSYTVQYVPGIISEAAIVTSFAPRCTELGLIAVRASGPTRRQVVRRGWRKPLKVNVFTVTCR